MRITIQETLASGRQRPGVASSESITSSRLMIASSELRLHRMSLRLLVIMIHMLELVHRVVTMVVAAIALVFISASSTMSIDSTNKLFTNLDSRMAVWASNVLGSVMVLINHSRCILYGVLGLIVQGLIMSDPTESSIRKTTKICTSISKHRLCLRRMSSIS